MNIVQLSSDYDRFKTDGGTPCGNISGLAAVMQRPAVKLLYTLPVARAKIDTRHYNGGTAGSVIDSATAFGL